MNRPESSSSAEQLDSPDREVLHLGSSLECTSPAPTSTGYAGGVPSSTGTWDQYDPLAQVVWDDEPPPQPDTATAAVAPQSETIGDSFNDAINQESFEQISSENQIEQQQQQQQQQQQYDEQYQTPTVDAYAR